MKILLLFLMSFISLVAFPQDIALSSFNETDRAEALEISYEIISILNKNAVDNLDKFLSGTETNINGQLWLDQNDFKGMLSSITKNKAYAKDTLISYTIDEALNSEQKQEISEKLSRVFSNNHMLISGKYTDLKDSAHYDFYLILGRINNNWKLESVYLSDVKFVMKNVETLPNHRIENLEEFGLEIPIPDMFAEKQRENDMITYTLAGGTPRDAIIQIFSAEKKAPIELLTYKWAEHIALNKYRSSNFTAKLHPDGIVYEYLLVDQNGNENKGISVGLEKKNKVIIIQYFSFSETYHEIWVDIDLMIRKLKI